MTRQQVFNFIQHFDTLRLPKENTSHNLKFALGINKSKLEPLYNVIMAEYQKVDEFVEYRNKSMALTEEYKKIPEGEKSATKVDVKGGVNPIINIDDDRYEEYLEKQKALQEEYKETIEKFKKSEESFVAYLKGDILDGQLPRLATVKRDDIPGDVYNTDEHFYLIEFMVEV